MVIFSLSLFRKQQQRLSGLSPFAGDNDLQTMGNVSKVDYDFEDESFDVISNEAKDFIEKLLLKNPS